MAAIARFLAREVPIFATEANIIKEFALFCAAGLLVFFLVTSYGLDLSPGFFWPRACFSDIRINRLPIWPHVGAAPAIRLTNEIAARYRTAEHHPAIDPADRQCEQWWSEQ
jgi:hypothetical protein